MRKAWIAASSGSSFQKPKHRCLISASRVHETIAGRDNPIETQKEIDGRRYYEMFSAY